MRLIRITGGLVGLLIIQLLFMPVAWAGLISTKQEIAIGKDVAKQIEEQYKLVEDLELQEKVSMIGRRIVAVCDRPDLPYTFKVLDVDEVNAMAAPGGFVYVFKGLIDFMPTDDELAGILAHEVSHVVKRHSMGQLEKSLGMTLLMGVVFGGDSLALQSVAISAISAGYSRSDERQADRLGYELSVKAGYNQYGMLMGLMKLYELNPQQKSDLFSDHPEAAARIGLVRKYLQEQHITVTAQLSQDGKSAKVIDGQWELPEIKISRAGTEPLYRAYLVAGNLYNITILPEYSADRYILDSDGTDITIYYDNQEIITITPGDAMAAGVDLEELVARYLVALKSWRAGEKME